MRMATSVHHTNPRSATLDFWRKTTRFEDYKLIQAKRRAQMNRPTRFIYQTFIPFSTGVPGNHPFSLKQMVHIGCIISYGSYAMGIIILQY